MFLQATKAYRKNERGEEMKIIVEGSVKEIQKLKSFPTEQLVEELKSREKKEISDAVAELLISLSKHGDLASLEAIRAILSDAYSE